MSGERKDASIRYPSVSLEILLYGLIALFAIWLRFTQLDLFPLTNIEAQHALSARGASAAQSPSAAHRAFTGLAFTLTGESKAGARWGPALAGVVLVLAPALLRRRIGRSTALISALLFAGSPVLWTASRTGDGTMLAALGVTAALFLLATDRSEWAAGALGLGLVSGPAALTGLASLGIGALLFAVLRRWRSVTPAYPFPRTVSWGKNLTIVVVVMLVIASGLGFFTDSLQSVFQGLGTWMNGWSESSGVAFVAILVMLIAYEPLISVLGVIGIFQGFRKADSLRLLLACWTLGSIVLLWLYRGRTPSDLVWIVIPTAISASLVISQLLNKIAQAESPWMVLGFTSAILALSAFAYLQLRAGVAATDSAPSVLGLPTQLVAAAMGVGLAIMALILLVLGWSREIAAPIAGSASVLVLLALSTSSGAALNFGEPTAQEMFRPQASTNGLSALRESLRVLSRAETGRPDALPIEVRDPPSPALAWAIRDFPSTKEPGSPAIVIAREGEALPGEYLGQSVTIGESLGWSGWLPPDLLRWMVTRDVPVAVDRWILLVRKDVAGVEEILPFGTES